jgi:TLD
MIPHRVKVKLRSVLLLLLDLLSGVLEVDMNIFAGELDMGVGSNTLHEGRNGLPTDFGTGSSGTPYQCIAEPQHLSPGPFSPHTSDESSILSTQEIQALANGFPARHRLSKWTLLYSSVRHGISLHTLYRKAAGFAPAVLVVRDTAGYVFGCYSSESWKVAPRYYGTGETFVFQIQVGHLAVE